LVDYIIWTGVEAVLDEFLIHIQAFAEQPEFFSNEFYFQVVLHNRSVSTSAQMILDFSEETQLSHEKTSTSKNEISIQNRIGS